LLGLQPPPLPDDIYIRYNCFKDAAEMKAAMVRRQPHKIDIGAVFNLPPKVSLCERRIELKESAVLILLSFFFLPVQISWKREREEDGE